ncbi:hypothetical protein O181_002603 [Austropuccinia psidii MF-1]|uniref:Integrase catalytic domain-containing protein n=1 Tax=Austropuccinia psidii MF-1 TaxID=1389203 RepID=A0A9Q3BCT7_9BASI|nr:hypothetical protein [Austropuccinia psidii MF-1]
MESKDPAGHTHDWVTLLPEIQMAYNNSQHSTTGKTPYLLEKGLNPLLPVEHLKKNLSKIHPMDKDFHDMWREACDKAERYIEKTKEYKKKRYEKTHKQYYKVLVSTLSFNDLKCPDKLRDSFLGPFNITTLIGINEGEVKLTEEF